ncbi:hypothetical protein DFQ27_000406 [Actinomortierella ambigua]|uniref:GDP-fucose pyrophosphorylase domain-containing protein n=1 Tax=Actinomortierella ambigua TaxID=1343610 RepID=A0A9P6QIW6_9FUNG|nr:hypothetical protein DFQ27_000406 [Actinomortierella ambigua]
MSVFVTSADGIELLASKAPFPSSTQPLRITALAHPSPLNIATTHGVFELAAESLSAQEQARLQDTPGLTFNNPRNHGEALAYTDSCYYFDPQTAIVLANLFPDLPRRCDLEAWADILDFQNTFHHASPASPTPQPLHPSIDLDNDHAHGRAMVHQALQQAGVQLELLVLNASQFYHLGTMTEFLDAVCLDVDFMATMGIENNVPGLGLVVADDGGKHRPVAGNDNEEEEEEDPQIIRSKDYTTTTITLQPPIFVQNSLLVSNNNALLACLPPWTMIIDTDLLASPQEKDNGGSAGHCNSNSNSPDDAWLPLATQQTFQGLPAGVCLFTLQLAADAFVTFSFSTKDDMKKPARTTTTSSGSSNSNSSGNHPETAPLQQQQQQQPWWETLCIFESIPVAKMLSPLFFAGNTESSDPVDENRSLWDAPIFEKAATKHESTLLALQRLARLTATTTTATTPTPSSSSSSSPSSPLARLLQKDVHVSGWISLKDAAEKARPYEIQG